ncbi:MAG: diadenylate cyclase CdaA [Pseudobdellovibrionaceae bacterium]
MNQFFDTISFIFSQIRWNDLIDVVLVWVVVYKILVLIKRTGTLQMLSGLGILAMLFLASLQFEFSTFNWLLEKFFSNLFVIVVILFQGEIRRALAQIGTNPFFTDTSLAQETEIVEDIVRGISTLAEKGCGALLVLEKDLLIDFFIEAGVEIDAKVSSELIISSFHPSSPIHDGAMLIRNGRIVSCGNILPLSKNPALDKNLGTRHRAAIGLTEETDALVIVVSEENRHIALVSQGHLLSSVDGAYLRQAIYDHYGLKYKLT